MIDKGMIFYVTERYKDSVTSSTKHYYVSMEFPSNNGNFRALDRDRKLHWFNIVTEGNKIHIVE